MHICRWLLEMLPGLLVWPWWVSMPVLGEKRSSPNMWPTFSMMRHRENTFRWDPEIFPLQMLSKFDQIRSNSECKMITLTVDVSLWFWWPTLPLTVQSFHTSSEISQDLFDGLAQNYVQGFIVPKWWILQTLMIPWPFHLRYEVKIYGFE